MVFGKMAVRDVSSASCSASVQSTRVSEKCAEIEKECCPRGTERVSCVSCEPHSSRSTSGAAARRMLESSSIDGMYITRTPISELTGAERG